MSFLKILKFETKNNQYIFDGISGIVLAVDDLLMDCINIYNDNCQIGNVIETLENKYDDKLKIEAAITFVEKYNEYGAFYADMELEEIKYNKGIRFNPKIVSEILKAGYTQQIILNVTEDCNMRCKYCYWSEEYKYTRNRTSKKMDIQVAISALKKYFELMSQIKEFNPGKKCAITFYGGEALLNYEVVKKV